jgi:hypothetical protein
VIVFALGKYLLSPTLPAIINDLAPPQAAGRLGVHHRPPARPRTWQTATA